MRAILLKLRPSREVGLLIALSTLAWMPLLTPAYFFQAHDARHSIFYLVQFDQTLRDGVLWPRWSPDFAFGYGYPLFNIYAPLAIYAAELIHLAGLSFVSAIKTMYILATIVGGIGMYGWVGHLFGRSAGLIAGVAYMFAPYHLVDLFVRSAYAEFVALAIIPYVFWAFTRLIQMPSLPRLAGAGFVYGILALTHHTSLFTFTPFLMTYILFLLMQDTSPLNNLKRFLLNALYPAGAGLLGAMLAAIYLLPMLLEVRYINVDQWTSGSYSYLDHFVYVSQLLSPFWGYGYAGLGLLDDFSYQIGIVIVVLTVFAGFHAWHHRYPNRPIALFFIAISLLTVWLMTPSARPIWEVVPLATLVQFPWRLLGVSAFTLAVVIGSLCARPLEISKPQGSNTPTLLIALALVLASFDYTLPEYTDIPDWAETPLAVIYWDQGSITDRVGMMSATEEQPTDSPMLSQYLAGEPLQVAGLIAGEGTVVTTHHGGSSDAVQVSTAGLASLQFYTYDYPGWQVTLNDQPLPHRAEPPYGLITVDLPPGEHQVQLRMGWTPPRLIGTLLSAIAFLLILSLISSEILSYRHKSNW